MLGLAAVSVAVPLIVADLTAQPVRSHLANVEESLNPEALGGIVESVELASGWHRQGRDYTDLALAWMWLGANAGVGGMVEHRLAEQLLATGLALSPANRLAWLRLAQLRMVAHGRVPENPETVAGIAQALSVSLRYGAAPERPILALVTQAGMAGWPHLDERNRRVVVEGVHRAWRRDPLATAVAAKRVGRSDLLATLAEL